MIELLNIIVSVIKKHPVVSLVYLTSGVALSLINLSTLWITKGVTNHLLSYINTGSMVELKIVVGYLLFQASLQVFQFSVSKLANSSWFNQLNTSITIIGMKKLFEWIWEEDYEYLEGAEEFSKLTAFQESIRRYLSKSITAIYSIFKSFSGVILYSIILIRLNWFSYVVVLVLTVPNVLISMKFSQQDVGLLNGISPERRHAARLLYRMTSKDAIRDVHLYSFGDLLFRKWADLMTGITRQEVALSNKQTLLSTFIQIFGHLLTLMAIIEVFLQSHSKGWSIGADLAILQALGGLEQDITSLFKSVIDVHVVTLALGTLKKKPQHNNVSTQTGSPTRCDVMVEVKSISFKYPSRNELSISNISLYLQRFHSYVVVGKNGSGKSTLIKCLVGLYSPTEGIVRNKSRKSTVVFQDFVIYPLTVLENITMKRENTRADIKKAWTLLQYMDLNRVISRLPSSIETVLDTTISKGGGLSQGELQKIAICRGLYQEPDVLFLDEPTASLDPIAEQDIYMRVMEFMKDRTIVFVSHRLLVCTLVDHVFVMSDGKLVDSGKHVDLVERCDLYNRLYKSRSEYSSIPNYI